MDHSLIQSRRIAVSSVSSDAESHLVLIIAHCYLCVYSRVQTFAQDNTYRRAARQRFCCLGFLVGADVRRIGEFVRDHPNISPIAFLMVHGNCTCRIPLQPHIRLMTATGNTEIMLYVLRALLIVLCVGCCWFCLCTH